VKIQEADVKVWLINTGWTGGAYGTGSRMKLKYTRAMITAAWRTRRCRNINIIRFGLIPQTCPDVPDDILNPSKTWNATI
jgi:phosphoenolpyruvate carboxykinase (ATP)